MRMSYFVNLGGGADGGVACGDIGLRQHFGFSVAVVSEAIRVESVLGWLIRLLHVVFSFQARYTSKTH